MRTAKQIGDEWEKKIAKMFGGRIQPGSGNQWQAKLDVVIGSFLVSCKATDKASFRVTDDMIREMRSLRNRPGGLGAEKATALMVKTANSEVVIMELDDFADLLHKDAVIETIDEVSRKYDDRIPQLLRDFSGPPGEL